MNSWVQCKPPAQVKILRRPKPVAMEQQQTATITTDNPNEVKKPTTSNEDKNTSHKEKKCNNDSVFEERILTEPVECNKQSTTSGEACSIVGRMSTNCIRGTQPPLQTSSVSVDLATCSTSTSKCHFSSHPQQQQQHQQPSSQHTSLDLRFHNSYQKQHHHKQHPSTPPTNSTNINKNDNTASGINKKLMKTYQERADEYAKARLRILGSAFPEDDDTLALSYGVDRILNLESQTCTTTVGESSSKASNSGDNNSDNRNFSNSNSVYHNNRVSKS